MKFGLISLSIFCMLVMGCAAQTSDSKNRALQEWNPFEQNKVRLDFENIEMPQPAAIQDRVTGWLTSTWSPARSAEADLSISPLAVAVINACLLEQPHGALTENIDRREMIPSLEIQVYSMQLAPGTGLDDLNTMAEQDPCVRGVSFDGIAELSSSSVEPRAPQQLHLQTINYFQALAEFQSRVPASSQSSDVLVSVIDTGIDHLHEDLQNQVAKLPSGYYGYNLYNNNHDTSDMMDHGTHVAGLIAANPSNGIGGTGVAGAGVRVFSARVFDKVARTSISIVANAVRYSVEQGADVINISLSGPGPNSILKDALLEATRKGVVVVVAAGNERMRLAATGRKSRWPASYGSQISGVITVGSVHSVKKTFSSFSNYGDDMVEIAAPGEFSILSTVPNNKYKAHDGTSMASPIVAGAVARLIRAWKSQKVTYTAAQVEKVLKEASPEIPALRGKVMGGKILDMVALAKHLEIKGEGEAEAPPQQPQGPVDTPPAGYWGTLQDIQNQRSSWMISGYICSSGVEAPERIRVLLENDSKGQYQPTAQDLNIDTWPAWSNECPESMFIQHHFSIEIDKSQLSGFLPANIAIRVTTDGVNWYLPGAGLYEIHP